MTFPLHCFQVLSLPLFTSLSCLPGKWLMPITGRGGSPITRTGSSAKTPASSTWSIQWACGSTWTDTSVRSSSQTRKAVTYAPWGVQEKHVNDKHPCAWTAELRDGSTPGNPVEVSVALPRGHPSMETSRRITFIVLVEAGLSGQQSYHSYVDLSSAPLTSEYVLALKRHPYTRFSALSLKQFGLD